MKSHYSDALIAFVIERLPDSISGRKRLLQSALATIPLKCARRVMLKTLLEDCEQMERDQMQFVGLLSSKLSGDGDGDGGAK